MQGLFAQSYSYVGVTKNNNAIDILTNLSLLCNIILQGGFSMHKEFEIGKKIKAIRQEKGLSQLAVVEKLIEQDINMSRETLSKIENNNRSISALELKALCNVLNVDIGDFFDEEESDDLVTFFRERNFSKNILKEISKLQEMVKIFINHEKIYKEGKN